MRKKKVVLIGGGPACLIAADLLADHCDVIIYEKGKTIGRKFLVAGKGGFNLTNFASGDLLLNHFTDHPILQSALQSFDSVKTRAWLHELGIPTFVGSSGRVFPLPDIKPATVLSSIKSRLKEKGVHIAVNSAFIGFNTSHFPMIKQNTETFDVEADHIIFGLGGASWSKTGSTGDWLSYFEALGIKTLPFEASNCGIHVDLPAHIFAQFAGTPIKNCALSIDEHYAKGEVLLTNYGLEGNLIYPSVPFIRKQLASRKEATVYLDFKPNNTRASLLEKTKNGTLESKHYKSTFRLDAVTINLLKSAMRKEDYLNVILVVEKLKAFPIKVQSLRPIEEAISTVGGISLEELNPDFTLKKHPHLSVIGEMLNWDAPTGGFLLQGCFSTGYFASKQLMNEL